MTMFFRIPFILLLLFFACEKNCPVSGTSGSGTQTTNGAGVSISDSMIRVSLFSENADGLQIRDTDVASVSVYLFGKTYTAFNFNGFADTLKPSDSAIFIFKPSSKDTYNLFIINKSRNIGLSVLGISLSSSSSTFFHREYFSPLHFLSGTVRDSSQITSPFTGVFIAGSPFFSLSDSLGRFHLSSVPAGPYEIIADFFSQVTDNTYKQVLLGFGTDIEKSFADSVFYKIGADSTNNSLDFSL